MRADVALPQEPCRVPHDVADRVEIEPPDHWDAWDSCLEESHRNRPHRRPRIAKLSDRVTVDWYKPVPLLEPISGNQIGSQRRPYNTILSINASCVDRRTGTRPGAPRPLRGPRVRPVVELRRLRRKRTPRSAARARGSPRSTDTPVIPGDRNEWQHVDGGSPAAAARRLIIAKTSRR